MKPKVSEVPKMCPFCDKYEGIIVREIEVVEKLKYYFDCDTLQFSEPKNIGYDYFCTKCKEHIREEDITEDVLADLSICCGASITESGMCSDCKEHVR